MVAELDGTPVTAAELESLALTSYGHFTSMRVDDGGVRGLDLHLARLSRDAKALFDVDLDVDHVRALVRRAVPASGSVVVRVTAYDPDLNLGHPEDATEARILVTTRPAGPLTSTPLDVRTCVYERDLPEVKSTGLFATIAHRRAARLAGHDDVLFTTPDGLVSEGATWNVGFFDGTDIVWPDANVLAGVTMDLLRATRPGEHRAVHLDEATGFPTAFATNAAVGVRAIARINDNAFDEEHPIIATLREDYARIAPQPV
ncbi:aminotransferase class IV [Myceligenerans cantabricum]